MFDEPALLRGPLRDLITLGICKALMPPFAARLEASPPKLGPLLAEASCLRCRRPVWVLAIGFSSDPVAFDFGGGGTTAELHPCHAHRAREVADLLGLGFDDPGGDWPDPDAGCEGLL